MAASYEDQNEETLPPGLVCPACGTKLIRRSMRRTLKDRLMSIVGRWPYRCEMCHHRFYGPQDPASMARESAGTEPADAEVSPAVPEKPES